MKSWLNLFWKEWHEQKWKLLSLTAIALGICLAMLGQDLENVTFSMIATIFSYALLAPIHLGMGVCAGEHASGVIQFVRAQPVSIRRVATVRWIVGACVLLIPLLCASVMCWIALCFREQVGPQSVRTSADIQSHPEWGDTMTLFVLSAGGMLACLNLYTWIVAIAVNQRTEFRAGLIGLLVTVVLTVAGLLGLSAGVVHSPDPAVYSLLCVVSGPLAFPGIFVFLRHSLYGFVAFAVVWQFLLTLSLMQVMVFRYGREERWLSLDFFSRTRATTQMSTEPGKPRGSRWRALLWLQLRQSTPVCLVGLVSVIAIVVLNAGFGPDSFDIVYPTVGCVLALLIGVGGYVAELQAGLHTFWRSRPISPGSWFWFKYIGGAIALIGLFDVPCVLLAWSGMVRTSSPGFAALFPMLLHLLCYSMAVFAAVSVRHSSYSTVIAVGALMVILIPEYADYRVPRFLSFFSMWNDAGHASSGLSIGSTDPGYLTLLQTGSVLPLFFLPASLLIGAIAVPATIIAAYLVKRDISIGS